MEKVNVGRHLCQDGQGQGILDSMGIAQHTHCEDQADFNRKHPVNNGRKLKLVHGR